VGRKCCAEDPAGPRIAGFATPWSVRQLLPPCESLVVNVMVDESSECFVSLKSGKMVSTEHGGRRDRLSEARSRINGPKRTQAAACLKAGDTLNNKENVLYQMNH
jgi:hypothetical protein